MISVIAESPLLFKTPTLRNDKIIETMSEVDEEENQDLIPPQTVYTELNYSTQKDQIWYIERVLDWESRIAAYDQETKDIYKLAIAKFEEARRLFAEDTQEGGWSRPINSKRRDLVVEQK